MHINKEWAADCGAVGAKWATGRNTEQWVGNGVPTPHIKMHLSITSLEKHGRFPACISAVLPLHLQGLDFRTFLHSTAP